MITADDFTIQSRGIRFEPEPHRYYSGATELVSVTTILKGAGVSLDFERLVADGKVSAEQLAIKRDLGKAAHAATHYYDEDALVAGTLDRRAEPFLESWIAFRRDTGFTPALLETVLWHPGLFIAGTIDRAGTFTHFAGCDPHDLYTVDIKLGDPEDAGAEWQTAAYATMLSLAIDRHSPWWSPLLAARPTFSVRLQESGRYKLATYPNTLRAWSEYQAFVTTYRRQHSRRLAVAHA
jgi:hypothetical protein